MFHLLNILNIHNTKFNILKSNKINLLAFNKEKRSFNYFEHIRIKGQNTHSLKTKFAYSTHFSEPCEESLLTKFLVFLSLKNWMLLALPITPSLSGPESNIFNICINFKRKHTSKNNMNPCSFYYENFTTS